MSHIEADDRKSLTDWRLVLVLVAFSALALAIAVRLVMLHTVEQPFLFEQGEKRTVRDEVQLASRGDILDRRGRPLAVSTPVFTLWLNPQIINLQQIPAVANILGMSTSKLTKRVRRAASEGRSFFYLKRQVSPAVAKDITAQRVAGVYAEDDFRRFYPAAEVTAQLLGIIDVDQRGQEGVELAYNKYLKGHDGARRVVKDLYGNVVKQLAVKSHPESGSALQLTLDLRLQYIAYRELKAAVQQHKAKSGSAVMLDAKTGEVLALVSRPSYNPNNRSQLDARQMRNRALVDVLEPGSTIKPFTVAAALESGKFNPDSIVNTHPGYVRVGKKTIRDHRNYGELDLTSVITKSSNVGTTQLAAEVGAESLWQLLSDVGIGQSDVLGMPGEVVGSLPYPEQMDDLRLATSSFGYGMSVSALQLARAYSVFQNGCQRNIHLVKNDAIDSSCHRIISEKTAAQVRQMLETVTSDRGTGSRARVPGYRVGGKTGTAHKVGRGGYEDSAYTAVFAGLAPLTDPDLVLVVVVDEPQGKEYYGGEVAAPVFSRIMQQSLNLRQIAPDQPLQSLVMRGGEI